MAGPISAGGRSSRPPNLAERIVAAVAAKSKKLGAQVRYERRSNRGEVVLEA